MCAEKLHHCSSKIRPIRFENSATLWCHLIPTVFIPDWTCEVCGNLKWQIRKHFLLNLTAQQLIYIQNTIRHCAAWHWPGDDTSLLASCLNTQAIIENLYGYTMKMSSTLGFYQRNVIFNPNTPTHLILLHQLNHGVPNKQHVRFCILTLLHEAVVLQHTHTL